MAFFSNFKIEFFVQFFSFPLVVWSHFFSKFKNKEFQFKLQNEKFSIFFLSNFPCGINDFFSEVAKFIKRLQKLPIYPYQKNSHILHTTT
jgi:hypothetical protein